MIHSQSEIDKWLPAEYIPLAMHVSAEGAKYTSADCCPLDWDSLPTTPSNTIRSHCLTIQGLMSPSEQIRVQVLYIQVLCFWTRQDPLTARASATSYIHTYLLEILRKTIMNNISVRDEGLLASAVYILEKTILQYLHWSRQLNVSVPTLKYSTPVYEGTIYGLQSTFNLQVGKWLRLETLPTWNVFLTREWNDKVAHCTPLSGTSPCSGRCEDQGSQVRLSRLLSTWLWQSSHCPQWHHIGKGATASPCKG